MDVQRAEQIYYTLIGLMEEEYCVPGVENLFAEGSECDRAYEQMLDAYARLCNRLDVVEEDADVEIIIDALLKIQRLIAMKMFEYGGGL